MKLHALCITRLVLLLVSLTVLTTGCSLHDTQVGPTVPVGKPAFPFDPKQAVFLSIAKADPRSGDHWSARVARVAQVAGVEQLVPSTDSIGFHDSDPWQITSYSDSTALTDHRANRGWILHFLDTLSTFRADLKMDAPFSPESAAKYGFSPPRYAVQWQVLTPEATQKTQTYELQIGTAVDFEKNPDGETFTVFPPSKDFYQANGAALVMLNYLKDFSSLRQETLSTLESDDVDRLEVFREGQPFYAQRKGAQWAQWAQWKDKKHHPLKEVLDVDGLLDLITHLRIFRFIDNPVESQKLLPLKQTKSSVKVILKDRYSQAVSLLVSKIANHTYATESSRPGAVFELYPESFDRLSQH